MVEHRSNNRRKSGEIIAPDGVNIWPHELRTARSLAEAGYIVEFIKKSEFDRETSADVLIDNEKWEFKAPNGGKPSLVEKNLRRGARQCNQIVFDSHRVKQIPDKVLMRELTKWSAEIKGIKKLWFVNRHKEIIDIK